MRVQVKGQYLLTELGIDTLLKSNLGLCNSSLKL